MRAGSGNREYSEVFTDKVIPALDDYKPEFILIGAGFDGHYYDPLAGMQLTTSTFNKMARLVKDAAARHCGGRIVSFLEGGYDLEGLAECVEEHLAVLAE
jgi:acetoin utilization deacetylase AcuC-like enzyme